MSDSEEPSEHTSLLRRTRKSATITAHGELSDRKRWWSIRVMYLTMFLSSVTFTLTISSIWPFLRVLDPGATTDFLGWVVSSYSLGQLIASPLFGMWANYRGRTREPLAVSITLGIGANMMYAYLESIPGNKGLYMIVARGIIGFGAGNVAVVRSYVAGATTLKERTGAMANVSIFQSIGFILGPVIQAAFVPLSYPGPVHLEGFHLNMYTAPAILGSVLCFINIILLFVVFKEYRVSDEINIVSIQSSYEESVNKYKPDYFAIISVILIFFVVLFIFTIFETIGTPLSMNMFAWTSKQSTLYIGVILAACGVEAIAVFIGLKFLSRRFNERYLLIAGFVFCFFGYFVQLPWGDGKLVIAPAEFDGTASYVSPTFPSISLNKRSIVIDTISDFVNGTLSAVLSQFDDLANKDATGKLKNSVAASMSDIHSTVRDVGLSMMTTLTQVASNVTAATFESSPTTATLTDAVISTAQTIPITPANLSTAATLSTTTATTTVTPLTDIVLSTAVSIATSTTSVQTTMLSTVSTAIANITSSTQGNMTTTVESVGCPATMDWCMHTPPVYLGQYIAGCIIISVGYPTASVMSYTLFSKILGPKPQGTWMGWLTASGSLARTLGPIFVSQIYNSYGPRVTFAADCGIILVTVIAIIVVFRRLVPCEYTLDFPVGNGAQPNQV